MELIIKNGQIKIPKKILKKANISGEGKCKIEVIGNEIRIKNKTQKARRILKLLEKSPVEQSIENMARASEVDYD